MKLNACIVLEIYIHGEMNTHGQIILEFKYQMTS